MDDLAAVRLEVPDHRDEPQITRDDDGPVEGVSAGEFEKVAGDRIVAAQPAPAPGTCLAVRARLVAAPARSPDLGRLLLENHPTALRGPVRLTGRVDVDDAKPKPRPRHRTQLRQAGFQLREDRGQVGFGRAADPLCLPAEVGQIDQGDDPRYVSREVSQRDSSRRQLRTLSGYPNPAPLARCVRLPTRTLRGAARPTDCAELPGLLCYIVKAS